MASLGPEGGPEGISSPGPEQAGSVESAAFAPRRAPSPEGSAAFEVEGAYAGHGLVGSNDSLGTVVVLGGAVKELCGLQLH